MSDSNYQVATLAGGCFWCIEAVFKRVDGVHSCVSGYTGGSVPNPSYQQVCTGTTGHAEAVQVTFDPAVISYESILRLFFKAHDPTTLNQQGADIGTQYRSAIFYDGDEQRQAAEAVVKELQGSFARPIVTEIVELPEFYAAEEYHQDYFERNPTAGYCRVVITPKLDKMGMPTAPIQ